MKIYNTQTKEKEEIRGKNIGLYACGPTVYDRAHIGNLRTYVNVDLLKRSLNYLGHEVNHVMNITDIEDKIINKAQISGISYQEITKQYEELFWQDLEKLNIHKPNHVPKATDEKVIKKMIEIVEKLIGDGFAYTSEDGSIYFAVNKFKGYGKLSHLDKSGIKSGARVSCDEYEKENAQDFALWKATKEGEPSWRGPRGVIGRPGWHIECSAMSMLYLGETVDIHAGGVDLVFPHHENEVAQSEAYTGKKFVKHWFHGEHLLVESKKMSKSLGNLYSLEELSEKFGVEPLAFRMLCLQSHYRDKLNFTKRSIQDAQNTLNNLRNFIYRIDQLSGTADISRIVEKSQIEFKKALEDDLNTPKATAIVFGFVTEINKINNPDKRQVLGFINDVDKVFGLNLKPESIDQDVKKIFDDYLKARENKDWNKSDELRQKIAEMGWVTEDLKCESILRKR
ncbi:MAG: cysteine--tRNA ligase [Patescibacteria group bacterium]|nr:cysteine--tRNA ligase [Patescibacteria group bacterium]